MPSYFEQPGAPDICDMPANLALSMYAPHCAMQARFSEGFNDNALEACKNTLVLEQEHSEAKQQVDGWHMAYIREQCLASAWHICSS